MKKVKIAEREVFPIGLGTAGMGDKADEFDQEVEAIRVGLDHGVQVIDTAESKRKVKLFIDSDTYEVLNYMDNKPFLKAYMELQEAEEIKVTKEEA
ncbi:hypothetical protein [Lederbergia ruris]|uniref:hypothetical protein n=1 Tax=Lederbergia ruris TaxID=217495 RepID=UPI0039A06E29